MARSAARAPTCAVRPPAEAWPRGFARACAARAHPGLACSLPALAALRPPCQAARMWARVHGAVVDAHLRQCIIRFGSPASSMLGILLDCLSTDGCPNLHTYNCMHVDIWAHDHTPVHMHTCIPLAHCCTKLRRWRPLLFNFWAVSWWWACTRVCCLKRHALATCPHLQAKVGKDSSIQRHDAQARGAALYDGHSRHGVHQLHVVARPQAGMRLSERQRARKRLTLQTHAHVLPPAWCGSPAGGHACSHGQASSNNGLCASPPRAVAFVGTWGRASKLRPMCLYGRKHVVKAQAQNGSFHSLPQAVACPKACAYVGRKCITLEQDTQLPYPAACWKASCAACAAAGKLMRQ